MSESSLLISLIKPAVYPPAPPHDFPAVDETATVLPSRFSPSKNALAWQELITISTKQHFFSTLHSSSSQASISSQSFISFGVILPILLLLISGNDPYTFLFCMGSGLTAMYAVKDAEKRSDLLRSSYIVVGANGLMLAAFGLLMELNPREFATLLIWGAGNGIVSVILTLGIIPFFEIIFNIPTNFRLLELSDLNRRRRGGVGSRNLHTPGYRPADDLADAQHIADLDIAQLGQAFRTRLGVGDGVGTRFGLKGAGWP